MTASAEKVIYHLLSNASGVTNLVSTRIYPAVLSQGAAFPAVSYFRVSGNRHWLMGSDAGIVHQRMQVSSWSQGVENYLQADQVAQEVRKALQRQRGTINGVEVIDILQDGDGAIIFEDEIEVYQAISDYQVIYRE
ncbi:MAG: hypothetical protein CMN85_10855 [Spongiibacteraceae bacterium]|uniref:tail completion protein gp17 n=1 Tax=uncultured Haliea sp. TaxID=622616 RepID=UPI000C5E6EB1|nr:hypothetical protein [Spongiibacteraceae bacterium]|tara:strand:+ start:24106 stop:24513 length:408 start_codon:yes stop_codon:yes gene_type:complete